MKVTIDYNLGKLHPELAQQWHAIKNGDLTSYQVTPESGRKVWWKCTRGHEWKAIIGNRTRGSECPYCKGLLPSKDYNLAVKFPDLAKEWHPTKNGELTPYNVTPGSTKKIWWKCSQGHEWETTVNHRSRGRGCPYCAGRRVGKDNNLAVKNPELASFRNIRIN